MKKFFITWLWALLAVPLLAENITFSETYYMLKRGDVWNLTISGAENISVNLRCERTGKISRITPVNGTYQIKTDNDGFYTDTANFGAEARVTFYDTTFTNERVNGYCDALWDYALELGWHPRGLAVWSYSEYQTQKKYTIHPNSDTINNTICARLYECYMDEPYSDIEDGVYYFVNYLYDFNTILFRVWSGEGAATCVFRRVGGVR